MNEKNVDPLGPPFRLRIEPDPRGQGGARDVVSSLLSAQRFSKKKVGLGPPGVPGFDPDPPARRGFPYVVNPLRHETIFSDVKLGNFLRFSSGGPLLSPLQEALMHRHPQVAPE